MRVRVLLLAAAVVAGVVSAAPATAHPDDPTPDPTHRCPCIVVSGVGPASTSLTLTAPVTLHQTDLAAGPDPSPVTGWVLQRSSDRRVVAGHVAAVTPTGLRVFSLSGTDTPVRVPAGRYVLTRLSPKSYPVQIPAAGLKRNHSVVARTPVAAPIEQAQAVTMGAAAVTLPLRPTTRLVLAQGNQDQATLMRLQACIARDPRDSSPECAETVARAERPGAQTVGSQLVLSPLLASGTAAVSVMGAGTRSYAYVATLSLP